MTDEAQPLGIIAGSGAANLLPDLGQQTRIDSDTPYGTTSAPIYQSNFHGAVVCVLNRHGEGHTIPPHRINYRANILAIAELGCEVVIAIATVGGIRGDLNSGDLLIPDQLIDYTWGRESTFFDGADGAGVGHLEMTHPYCHTLRNLLLQAAANANVRVHDGGVYAVTQGPRFETAAEINRIENDGGDVVGMTGMPEAALAAEKRICYASVNLVVNPAAGRGDQDITMDEIRDSWNIGYENLCKLLKESIRLYATLGTKSWLPNSQIMQM